MMGYARVGCAHVCAPCLHALRNVSRAGAGAGLGAEGGPSGVRLRVRRPVLLQRHRHLPLRGGGRRRRRAGRLRRLPQQRARRWRPGRLRWRGRRRLLWRRRVRRGSASGGVLPGGAGGCTTLLYRCVALERGAEARGCAGTNAHLAFLVVWNLLGTDHCWTCLVLCVCPRVGCETGLPLHACTKLLVRCYRTICNPPLSG